ncbi:MAG: TolB family protein [Acidimicrobiales bacterium]
MIAGVALVLAGCLSDHAGPVPLRGRLMLNPVFGPVPLASFDFARITLTRLAGAGTAGLAPVVDTVVPFPAAADSLVVDVSVPLQQPVETLTVRLAMFDTLGDTTFRAGPYPVVVVAGSAGSPVAPPVRFAGPASVVFAGDSAGGLSSGVFSVKQDGTGRLRLDFRGATGAVTPRWSPDYQRVAFTVDSFPQPSALFIAAATGDTTVQVVGDSSVHRPRWSPDGLHLAFECGARFSRQEDVCVIPDVARPLAALNRIGDGAGKVFVTDFDTAKVKGPASFVWDPLAPGRLAVVRDTTLPPSQTPASRIYTVDFDGRNAAPLSPPVMDVGKGPLLIQGTMDWSSDGAVLAFAATDTAFNQYLYVINRDGSGLRKLTGTLGDFDDQPVFSPDGQEILFWRDRSICSEDLWRIGRNGGGASQISNEQYCDVNRDIIGYDWSPDGSDIVLVGRAVNTHAIYKVPIGTTAATYLSSRVLLSRVAGVSGFVQDMAPTWRP